MTRHPRMGAAGRPQVAVRRLVENKPNRGRRASAKSTCVNLLILLGVRVEPLSVRQAHRDSVKVALNEMEKFVQARMGGNRPPETTGKWIATNFEHDSARHSKRAEHDECKCRIAIPRSRWLCAHLVWRYSKLRDEN